MSGGVRAGEDEVAGLGPLLHMLARDADYLALDGVLSRLDRDLWQLLPNVVDDCPAAAVANRQGQLGGRKAVLDVLEGAVVRAPEFINSLHRITDRADPTVRCDRAQDHLDLRLV